MPLATHRPGQLGWSGVRARCPRAEGRPPGRRCGARGAAARVARGRGHGRGGAGGVAGRARTGWDVTSGALCIVGILGPPLLVPVPSAAEPGGGGERGVCGREARGRAGRRGARTEKGASGPEGTDRTPCRRRHHRAARKCRAEPSPRGRSRVPGPVALFRPRVPGSAPAWRAPGALVRPEPPGPRRGLARTAPSRGRAGRPLVLFRKQTRKPTPHHRVLLPARGRFCAEEAAGPRSPRPFPLGRRADGSARGRRRPRGAGWQAWAPRAAVR